MRVSGRRPVRGVRVLLSEGASTSAREAVTALGLAGYHVEVCDPDPRCLSRFSRFVRRFHRCPGLGENPDGFLAFILDRVSSGEVDVLLPIHEQGYLFASVQDRLAPFVASRVPSFESYRQAHSKVGFQPPPLGARHPAARDAADRRSPRPRGPRPLPRHAERPDRHGEPRDVAPRRGRRPRRRRSASWRRARTFDEPFLVQEIVRRPGRACPGRVRPGPARRRCTPTARSSAARAGATRSRRASTGRQCGRISG